MIIYTAVNEKDRIEFEKKYQISYGFNNAPIFHSPWEAIRWFHKNLGPNEMKEWVIEKHESGYRDVVFRL